jgi:formylglycine-generating enzyme
MNTIITLKKVAFAALLTFTFSLSTVNAQTDTMYIMKAGAVVGKYNVNTQVDSVIFYKPTSTPVNPVSLQMVNIPAGTFTMGSPTTEANRDSDETQYQVTLSAFRMSKYEITNAQYAAFLNAKSIGSDGKYAAGAYPAQTLIYASSGIYNWGLNYTGGQWVPVAGYENHPVIRVTWYGATEFATYVGGTLPTEAQWEYAARGGTTTPFNTGACLSNVQANYSWSNPYSTCTNTVSTYPGTTQAVGTYTANAWGLHDMHGNVWEWCSDWYGTYPTTAQTNPTGATSGSGRVTRGGSWYGYAQNCRSANRRSYSPGNDSGSVGFRVVLVP